MFLKEVYSAHQGCLFDRKYCKYYEVLLQFEIDVFYVNSC